MFFMANDRKLCKDVLVFGIGYIVLFLVEVSAWTSRFYQLSQCQKEIESLRRQGSQMVSC